MSKVSAFSSRIIYFLSKVPLVQYNVYANSEDSGETAHMRTASPASSMLGLA